MFGSKIKIIINILLIVTLIFLTACEKGFAFRGSHFGDSVEQVQQNESNVGEVSEEEGYKYLSYYDGVNNYGDYISNVSYDFKDDKLILITELIYYYEDENDLDKDDVFEELKKELSKYGSPDEEEWGEVANTALWEAGDFGLVLFVAEGTAILAYSAYPERARESYFDTQGFFTNLLRG